MLEIPARLSQQAIVTGNVAELLAVPKATIIASATAEYKAVVLILLNSFRIKGYVTNNCIANPNKTATTYTQSSLIVSSPPFETA